MNKEPVTCFDRQFLAKNLKKARKNCNLTRDDVLLLSKTGLSRSSLQAWESAEREPKLDYIYDLAEIYGVHPWELLSGEKYHEDPIVTTDTASSNDEYDYIDFYSDVEASAGIGLFTDGAVKPTKHLAFRKTWIKNKGVKAEKLKALITKGDSMEPTIRHGAVIVIDTTQTNPIDGGLYVVRIADDIYIKRVQKIPFGLRLISDNKAMYDSLDINMKEWGEDQVEICGKLIHTAYDI